MSKKEQTKEWKRKIDECVKVYKSLDELYESMKFIGIMHIEGSIFQTIFHSFETMLDLVDYNGWIAWHIYDNDCGDSERDAKIKGKKTKIRTSQQLAKVIVAEIS